MTIEQLEKANKIHEELKRKKLLILLTVIVLEHMIMMDKKVLFWKMTRIYQI